MRYIARNDCFLRSRISAGAELTAEGLAALNGGKLPDAEYMKANFAQVGTADGDEVADETSPGPDGFGTKEELLNFLTAKGVPVRSGATKKEMEVLLAEYRKTNK